ncbi:MAG: hypothetical protein ACE364_04550 [Chlorobiota bacterium]
MKMKVWVLLTAFLLMLLSCNSSNDEAGDNSVPDKVLNSFSEQFGNPEGVVWEHEDDKWEAEFEYSGKEYEVVYDENAKWVKTEYKMKERELTENMKNILAKDYSMYEILEIEKYETPDNIYYKLEMQKGGDIDEIVIYPNGKIKKIDDGDSEDNSPDMDND